MALDNTENTENTEINPELEELRNQIEQEENNANAGGGEAKPQEFKKNPMFAKIGERTKAEQDLVDKNLPPTIEELEEENNVQEPMSLEELYDYADMLVTAWTMGMVMAARAVSMNQIKEDQLQPSASNLKSLKKITAKVMYKYQKRAPLLFMFFFTVVVVYFPGFRDAYQARKEFKNRNQNKPNSQRAKMEVVKPAQQQTEDEPWWANMKRKDMTPEQQAQFDKEAEEASNEREALKPKRKPGQGRKKRGFVLDVD